MANPLANTIFKLNFNGQKIKVRVLEDGERITSRCIQRSFIDGYPFKMSKEEKIKIRNRQLSETDAIEQLKKHDWHSCTCVGEKTDEHNHEHRVYLEVLSAFFQPISSDIHTEKEDKGKADL